MSPCFEEGSGSEARSWTTWCDELGNNLQRVQMKVSKNVRVDVCLQKMRWGESRQWLAVRALRASEDNVIVPGDLTSSTLNTHRPPSMGLDS